jgi:hypothetical protein
MQAAVAVHEPNPEPSAEASALKRKTADGSAPANPPADLAR